jgi:hypothetical protein
VHCHHHAVLGWDADRQLLEDAGATIERLDSGCCGLAGNFGFEAGHLDVSKACAEQVLLPAIRGSSPDDVVLADGFSCRTQIHELDSAGREAIHLSELLARGQHAGSLESTSDEQPATGIRRFTAVGLALAGVASLATLARWLTKGRYHRWTPSDH